MYSLGLLIWPDPEDDPYACGVCPKNITVCFESATIMLPPSSTTTLIEACYVQTMSRANELSLPYQLPPYRTYKPR